MNTPQTSEAMIEALQASIAASKAKRKEQAKERRKAKKAARLGPAIRSALIRNAAPDMLVALEEMVSKFGFGSSDPSIALARAAIAKARGGK